MGDCVLTTPAIHILKKSRPDLRIGIVVDSWLRDLFEDNPDIHDILDASVFALRSWRPTLCLNLHGGTRSMRLTLLSGAAYRAGFAHHSGSAIYNVRIPRAQEILGVGRKVHTAEHLASAMFFLGVEAMPVPRARLFAGTASPAAPYAVIHPVASTPEKTWRAEGFIEIARYLEQHGLEPVFAGGGGDDLTAFRQFRVVANAPLRELKTLLRGASLFVGNDSGPAHVAAAFGVPVVVLFGPSDPVVWAPWRVDSQVLVGPQSIQEIEAEQVIRAAETLLRVPQ
jgi:ADP-heptose:LPS heptosyltransferase